MRYITSVVALATSLSLASATGITYNREFDQYHCEIPNGVYCAGGNIIVRCKDGIGQPGNCNDNLAGEPPLGGVAECYALPHHEGKAACAKNCIVYGDSGNLHNRTFPIPDCQPQWTSTTTVSTPGVQTIYTTVTSTDYIAVCPSSSASPPPESVATSSATIIVPPPISLTTIVPPPVTQSTTTSAVVPPPISLSSTMPMGTGTGVPPPPSNGTMTTFTIPSTPTATPVGPTTTQAATTTANAAIVNTPGAGVGIAALAVMVAYLL